MNAIEIQQLVKRFGKFTALDHLDLTVSAGVIFGFLGPNGAGKTTTLRILAGLAKPTTGRVAITGIPVNGSQRPPFGFLPDTPSFYNWMKAGEFLAYIARVHGLQDPPIAATLEMVGLGGAGRKGIGSFSRGMRQRLGLAQALLPRPKVLLLDEPVSALDPAGRKEVLDILTALRGQITVFFSTHILSDAERICDQVAILDHGRLLLQSDRDSLLARYAQPIYEIDTTPGGVGQLAELAARLQTVPWTVSSEQQGTRLRIKVNDMAQAQVEILALCQGIPLLRLEMVGATLEDVFLKLTQEAAI
jgi:ABC-2 type transport system ATP-binding protein